MGRAIGARSQIAAAFETVYGMSPVSGFTLLPFISSTLGGQQALLDSNLLGYGRDPLDPVLDALDVDGDVVVPVDIIGWGFWLKNAFGDPVTTGAGPYTHTFASGSYTIPGLSVEVGFPDVPSFGMYAGCKADSLSWTMTRKGLLQATVKLIGQGETLVTATAAGTPAALSTVTRFNHFQGEVKRNGVALGAVVSAEIMYKNNLDRIEVVRSDGKIDGLDPGMAELSGSLTMRFDSTTMLSQSVLGNACELEFLHTSGTSSFKLTAHAVYLSRPRREVKGPQGVEITFDFKSAKAVAPARMCTAVLVNARSNY